MFHNEGVKTLAQAARRGDGCPIPGNTESQVGWSSEQPDLLKISRIIAGGFD